jgi:hypothetical protein
MNTTHKGMYLSHQSCLQNTFIAMAMLKATEVSWYVAPGLCLEYCRVLDSQHELKGQRFTLPIDWDSLITFKETRLSQDSLMGPFRYNYCYTQRSQENQLGVIHRQTTGRSSHHVAKYMLWKDKQFWLLTTYTVYFYHIKVYWSDLHFIISAWQFSFCCTCEVKMVQNNGEFTANESWEVMKYIFLKGKVTKNMYDDMPVTLGDKCPSLSRQEPRC